MARRSANQREPRIGMLVPPGYRAHPGGVITEAGRAVGAENLCHLGRYLADTRSTRFVLGARRAGLGVAGDGMIFGLWA